MIRYIKKAPIILSNYCKAFATAIRDLRLYYVMYFPGQTGKKLRAKYYRKRLKYMGKNVRIEPGVFFQQPDLISLDDNCWIDFGVVVLAGKPRPFKPFRLLRGNNQNFEGEIFIGKNVHIAPHCTISGMGGLKIGDNVAIASKISIYTYSRLSRNPSVLYTNGMIIEDNVLIGTNATLIGVPLIKANTIIKPNTVIFDVFGKNSLEKKNEEQPVKKEVTP